MGVTPRQTLLLGLSDLEPDAVRLPLERLTLARTLATSRDWKVDRDLDAQVGPTGQEVRSTLRDLRGAVSAITGVTKRADSLLRDDSAVVTGLVRALDELSGAARSLKKLADTLERQPESLIRGK